MIGRLIELVERDIDQVTGQLAALRREQSALAAERAYWTQHLSAPPTELSSIDAIREVLQYGARADRELKTLAEKDFLVETRIVDCRNSLSQLSRRKEALSEVLARRERAEAARMARRQERDMVQRGLARRALKEAEEHQCF